MAEEKVIKDHQEEFFQILLTANGEGTKVDLTFPRLDPGADLTVAMLREILDDGGIVYGLQTNTLKSVVERVGAGESIEAEERFVVARAKPAAHAEDGHIDFLVEPSPEEVYFEIDEDDIDTIDYKNTNLIQNVTEQQHLATIVQPGESEDGVDVFGERIEGRQGDPIKVKLGPNMLQEEERLYSACNGRFLNENGVLSVSPVYTVRDNVGYRVGNINFLGKVEIQKDVLDDFSVVSENGVEVMGVVQSANVESKGDVIINGGMNGKMKGFLRSEGKVESKYFNDCTVVAWGDIDVQKSIVGSTIKTKGKVEAPHANIRGGEVSALMGIDVGTVGSDLGVITTISAGRDYETEDRIKAYESQLLEISKEIDKIDLTIGPLLSNKSKLMALPVQKKKAIKSLLEELKRYREEQGRLRIESENLQQKVAENCVKEIIVRKLIYSGTRIVIGTCKKVIKMDVKGPVRLREDLENDTISITGVTL